MKELEELGAELLKHLMLAKANPNLPGNSHVSSEFQNRENDILDFIKLGRRAETNPLYKDEIIKNFTLGANRIKSDIDKIRQNV